MHKDEFYIGYHSKAPSGIASSLRKVVMGLFATGIALAVVLVLSQQPLAHSTFEFLQYRTFEGTIAEHPYPSLRVERPGRATSRPAHSRYHLVDEGKFGAQERVSGLDGQDVRLEGALIYRDSQTMIEMAPGAVTPIAGPGETETEAPRRLGMHTLQGEIVDSKCFLGVMNPGHLKPHRACAVRCISGGIPPVLAVRTASDETLYYLLVSSEGQSVNQDVLGIVAEPVEITGEVTQHDNLLILHANPSTYRRIDS